ncbi:MAG: hypothetical protein ACJ72N_04765 [Labedaea sp.]
MPEGTTPDTSTEEPMDPPSDQAWLEMENIRGGEPGQVGSGE